MTRLLCVTRVCCLFLYGNAFQTCTSIRPKEDFNNTVTCLLIFCLLIISGMILLFPGPPIVITQVTQGYNKAVFSSILLKKAKKAHCACCNLLKTRAKKKKVLCIHCLVPTVHHCGKDNAECPTILEPFFDNNCSMSQGFLHAKALHKPFCVSTLSENY